MRVEHRLPSGLLEHRVLRVLVVGAGGTGSAITMGLPYLDQAMRVWGYRYGLTVAQMDADVVSETNCIRQPFSRSDTGQNKATVLINRINLFWGTNWQALPQNFHERSFERSYDRCPDLVIGCVDTRAARRAIAGSLSRSLSRVSYWLLYERCAYVYDERPLYSGPRSCAYASRIGVSPETVAFSPRLCDRDDIRSRAPD